MVTRGRRANGRDRPATPAPPPPRAIGRPIELYVCPLALARSLTRSLSRTRSLALAGVRSFLLRRRATPLLSFNVVAAAAAVFSCTR